MAKANEVKVMMPVIFIIRLFSTSAFSVKEYKQSCASYMGS